MQHSTSDENSPIDLARAVSLALASVGIKTFILERLQDTALKA
jgi:hypothetical protein